MKNSVLGRAFGEEAVSKDAKYVFQTYGRQPIVITRGQGALVWDADGREYIDCVAGIAVNNLGHCHPRVVAAIKEQVERLIHTSNLYYNDLQPVLAEKLAKLSGMDKVFFANSGTESIEAALKLARKETGNKGFIAAEHCFHGRTMGALSITHKEKYRKPFEPLVPGARFVPYGDAEAIRNTMDADTAAVILEPVQGEGGVNIPDKDYLKEVKKICDKAGVVLIFDEVQTGMGRTGKWFGKDHFGVQPDIMCVAKGIAGGFPMGVMMATDEMAKAFGKGDHASTFGGSPLACAAALGTIQAMEEEKLVERSAEMGEYMRKQLEKCCKQDFVDHVRGLGLMIGVQLKKDGNSLVAPAREKGVLINVASDTVIRMVPPFVITKEQVDRVAKVVGELTL
ncbi:acetylornithine transaminase [Methanocella arvoryzae]|uniref:Acetylornithine aminotransferase n=1 Tax=Methanocella arvoryzae (strain DSM 22066 / NBRC 105507 / MRE50) TaxID=351160 RepID=Q0W469_METAR|nr:acetylornithine transaminase [Methanocella arvoryzae]CAJ36824.1 acetylornithine aminotransferase [Methanocella arvoryzae MRE50]